MDTRKYLTPRDVELRLHDTVVKFGDDYYHCVCTVDNTRVRLQDLLNSRETFFVDPNDETFEARPPDLGWFYQSKRPVFAVRLPYRRQKQGIDTGNLAVFDPFANLKNKSPRSTLSTFGGRNSFFNTSFRDMLRDEYTRIDPEKMTETVLKNGGLILSKNFAIVKMGDKEYRVFYQMTDVGKYDVTDGRSYLEGAHDHSIFRNALTTLGVNCA